MCRIRIPRLCFPGCSITAAVHLGRNSLGTMDVLCGWGSLTMYPAYGETNSTHNVYYCVFLSAAVNGGHKKCSTNTNPWLYCSIQLSFALVLNLLRLTVLHLVVWKGKDIKNGSYPVELWEEVMLNLEAGLRNVNHTVDVTLLFISENSTVTTPFTLHSLLYLKAHHKELWETEIWTLSKQISNLTELER